MRTDVTAEIEPLMGKIGCGTAAPLRRLDGPLPDKPIGHNCFEPRDCPFLKRCWPDERDHIMRLYSIGPKRGVGFLVSGVHRISDLPPNQKLNDTQKRQIRAMKEGRSIVEPELAQEIG